MHKYDLIVIGSGLAGVHAAATVVEKGLSVLMLDVGIEGSAHTEEQKTLAFEDVRKTDPEQYKIFLGDDLSGIDALENGRGHGAAMASGRRAFVTKGADVYGPLEGNGAEINQSFARGGLSEVWSGVCDLFDEDELRAIGVPWSGMKRHYEKIIERIGVSGEAEGFNLQPAPCLDDNAEDLMRRYLACRESINGRGFRIAQPLYAMLTQDFGDRKAQSYRDMDFWDSAGRTLYRARYTLEELEREDNFSYSAGLLVERIADSADDVTITARDVANGELRSFTAKAVIVAAGAVNTTRVLLRSFDLYGKRAPLLLKNYHLLPCLFPARLGKKIDPKRHSFSQLAIHGLQKVDGMGDLYAQFLSYNSLLLHKLLRYMPLPMPEAFRVLSILAPALVLVDVRFPSLGYGDHGAILRKSSEKNMQSDFLEFEYPESEEIRLAQKGKIRELKKTLRSLGLIPLSTIRYPYGSPSHYAGGVPFSLDPSEALSVNESGQVHGHRRIFVGDSATWRALPAKPSGLTIMANADRIGESAADFLKGIQ